MTISTRPGKSWLLGLVGARISASLSPALHEREAAAAGLHLSYRLIDVEPLGMGTAQLPELLEWATRLGFDGLNVTHPFKQAVVPLLDEVSEEAADLGAVNTVVLRDGKTLGHNTDWSGFSRAFRKEQPDAVEDRVALVGAGGAGAAVGYGLLAQGAELVTLYDVDHEQARVCALRLAKRFGEDRVRAVADIDEAFAGAHGMVNATPLGMLGYPGLPIPGRLVRPELWVADVVYFPLETELVRLATERGCRVVRGGGMAVGQAIGAFELFTGRVGDAARMAAHFRELTTP